MFSTVKKFLSLRCEISTGCKETVIAWNATRSGWHVSVRGLVLCPEHAETILGGK